MSPPRLPSLAYTTVEQTQIDCLGWTDGRSYSAYGLHFGLRSNDPATLAQATQCLPLGWQPAPISQVDILYSIHLASPNPLQDEHKSYSLYCGSDLILRTQDLSVLLFTFENHSELLTAFRAQNYLFVHAGVVGWHGQAILIPGRTMTGKTTLVKALVQIGATYYSDEFAVLDKEGQVHPYAAPLSIRGPDGQPGRKTPVEALGAQAGIAPLPVGLIVVTQYQPKSKWQPRQLSPAQALLACMDNTVAAQREPQYTMPILRKAVLGARAIQSKRGEAKQVARALLRLLE